MKSFLVLAVVLGIFFIPPVVVNAACPNACSGHGTCGDYDSCTCHTGFMGGDCSLRICAYHWSWITTSQGDLNYDGDANDATVYDTDHLFVDGGVPYLKTQASPGGTWENWPSIFNKANVDEGHFYMECSNRGICDRSKGTCTCFEGYTGCACRRTRCPEDCNGHGTCQTVADQKGAYTYNLWDAEMSRSCACDPGYTGPSCKERFCPKGDDPLTTGQHNEIQWVDVHSDYDATLSHTFSGYIRLLYTDEFGEVWETDQIAVEPYTGTGTSDMATNVANALNNLPNNVLDGVTVTQGYCENVIPGNVAFATNALTAATNAGTTYTLASKMIRCPSSSLPEKVMFIDTTTPRDDDRTAALTPADIDDTTCYEISHQFCVRFKIDFGTRTGDVAPLQVDTSAVTINGETTEQGATTISSTVTDQLQVGVHDATGGITASYTHPSQTTKSCNGAAGCAISSQVITVDADGTNFGVDEKITVSCQTRNLGTYTVSASTATTITVTESIPDCTPGASETVDIALASYFLTVNADLTSFLSPGAELSIGSFSGVTPSVDFVRWDATTGVGRVFLTAEHVGDDTNDGETGTTAGTDAFLWYGTGTTENNECADRGLCDRETGLCRCFKGYTGEACQMQNSLVA